MINIYPYTDTHELNLDWILKQIKLIETEINEFEAINKITFSGNWDISMAYPAWTVVNDGNGNGFLSLQPVPAGVDLTNTDYWVQVCDYAMLWSDLNDKINALDARVTDVEDIQAKGFDTSGKWVFLGDSYDTTSGSWIDATIYRMGLTQNTDAFNIAVSGHGFYGGSWENDFRAFVAGRTDLDEFKHVIVGGGLNDAVPAALTGTVLSDAIKSFCDTVKQFMPNAFIQVAYLGNILNDSPYISGRTAGNIIAAIQIYNSAFPDNGAAVLGNCEYIMHNYSLFAADHIHPNASGVYRIACGVTNAIMTGRCNVLYEYIGDRADGPFAIGTDFQCLSYKCVVNNEYTYIYLENICNPNRGTNASVTDAWFDLGVLPSGVLPYMSNLNTIMSKRSTSNNAISIQLAIKIENRHLYIASRQMSNYTGYSSFTMDNTQRLDLFDLSICLSTLLDSQA